MKVHELIEILKQQPADAEVTLWVDGDRFPTIDIDTSFVEGCNFVEINAGEIP
jgi:hypothetical protein